MFGFDDDIFEEMRKMMRNPFKGFFDDDEINEEEEKDAKNADKKTNAKKDRKTDKHSKSYSISYKFGTGMKEPEIKVEGDVDKETVDHFLKGITKPFGLNAIPTGDFKLLKPAIESEEQDEEELGYKTPFMDIQETKTGATLTIEMPGIAKEEVKLEFKDYGLVITGIHDSIKFRKELSLGFKPKQNAKISANNGIILIELEKA